MLVDVLASVAVELLQRGDVEGAVQVMDAADDIGPMSAGDFYSALDKIADELGWASILKRAKEATEMFDVQKDLHRPTLHGGDEQEIVDVPDPGFGNPGKDFTK